MKDLEVKDIPAKILPLIRSLKRYLRFMYFVSFAAMCGFLIFRINTFTRAEPTDDQVAEKLQNVQRPKIDEAALAKIKVLQDQNIDVKSLFQQARDNPFSE